MGISRADARKLGNGGRKSYCLGRRKEPAAPSAPLVAAEPDHRKHVTPEPSAHDDYCDKVAQFVREGLSYSDALDIVLESEAS